MSAAALSARTGVACGASARVRAVCSVVNGRRGLPPPGRFDDVRAVYAEYCTAACARTELGAAGL